MTALILVLLIQAVVTPPVWPVTVSGWITLTASVATLGYVLYDRIWAKGKRDAEINGIGERVKAVELSATRLDERVSEQGLQLRETVSQVGAMREEFGETRRAIKELTDAIRESNDKTHQLVGNIRVDIARAEERIAAISDIKDVIRDLFSHRRDER